MRERANTISGYVLRVTGTLHTRTLLFALALATVTIVSALYATSVSAADAPVVRVGIYENAPKVFTDESGHEAGIFVDVITSIADSEGWQLQYVHGTFAEGLERLEKGEIDLMPDVALTPDRQAKLAFHLTPVLSSWSQVYAREGSDIRSIVDLNGKRVTVLAGLRAGGTCSPNWPTASAPVLN